MENDKAKAFFILNEDDVIDRKVGDAIERLFTGHHPNAMRNQETLGRELVSNWQVSNTIASRLMPNFQQMVMDEICTNLRMDTYIDKYQQLLHIRLSYKGNGVTQQSINLRGY
jgi:hypothetical protein